MSGQAEANVRVWAAAESGGAGAENLRIRQELDVDFEADHGLVLGRCRRWVVGGCHGEIIAAARPTNIGTRQHDGVNWNREPVYAYRRTSS